MLRLATRIIRELTVNYRKFSMKEKRFMENSRSIHGNLRSSTQWKQRNYYFVELTLNYQLSPSIGLLPGSLRL
jgi:hypothetical protein